MPKRALVLAGGGARGPYQIGVWQALQKLGVDYHIVVGTSVGALNGALMVQGDLDLAVKLWENVTTSDVVQMPDLSAQGERRIHELNHFLGDVVAHGGLDVMPLEQLIRQAVDEERVRSSPIELGLVTTQYPKLHPLMLRKEEIPQGELVDYLLASASYFPIFRSRRIEDGKYVDGALSDNLPAELAIDCGAEELVVVDLHAPGIVHRYKRDLPVIYIHSYWDLGQTMDFRPWRSRRNMRLGYLDTMKAYRRLEGYAYAFGLGETRANALRLHGALLDLRRRTGVDILSRYEKGQGVQRVLRYRRSRFLQTPRQVFTLGRAVTTAAEITGELLAVPPDKAYTFPAFNTELLNRWHSGQVKSGRSRRALERLCHMLETGYRQGGVSDAFWAVSTVFHKEMAAACYLWTLKNNG